jgi:hypothetical protein
MNGLEYSTTLLTHSCFGMSGNSRQINNTGFPTLNL